MNPSFQKGKPIHKVWHKIETADHAPCKTKRCPVLANEEKDKMWRETWEKMLANGIIEVDIPILQNFHMLQFRPARRSYATIFV